LKILFIGGTGTISGGITRQLAEKDGYEFTILNRGSKKGNIPASAYQKPLSHYVITESTPLANPHWQYSRDKIACEQVLMDAYRNTGFPGNSARQRIFW